MATSLLIAFIIFFIAQASAELPDEPTMAALKEELSVPEWSSPNSNYCSWRGVTCNQSTQLVEKLELSRLGLRGNISLISKLTSLQSLDLSSNSFHGSIPSSFGDLVELVYLDLSMNKFESSIPSSLGSIVSLKSLNLSNNLLTGQIPNSLKSLEKLEELQISGNSLGGYIPDWIGNFSELRLFSAYENRLSGGIPKNLGLFSKLRVLNLHSNNLNGVIPESIFSSGELEILVLTVNGLNGRIPESIGNCKWLSSVRIGNNRLVGRIPLSIGNASSLTYFEANDNLLSGEIPKEFAKCSNLTLLNLASNLLAGVVPLEFGDLKNLQELILSNNSLTGDIPKSLLKCRNLSKLDMSNNKLIGSLPINLCDTSRLQFLHLDRNAITGEIPHEIGNCVRLLELQLGSNLLSGTIPSEIGRIKNLQIALNLSFNQLYGPLPEELGKLDKLVSLDVSNNKLSGTIPMELKGMLSLIEVNFSNNELTGQIPIFGPFQNSPSSSFSGNRDLCGNPLNSSCGYLENEYEVDNHKVSYKIVLVVVGSGLTVFTTVSVIVILFMLREKQELSAKAAKATGDSASIPNPVIVAGNVFADSMKQAVDFDSVVKATYKDSNKLSNGTFSTVYKAIMPSGLVLYVKQLKSVDKTVVHYQNKMTRELERLGKLSHANLMRPIGYVIYEDVALLLHNHMPNGTLAQYLHETPQDEYKPDWPMRLSIAIGVAEGLAFLHQVATIHLDISSSNIFLDSQFNALIGEIEISKLLDPSKGTASISAVAGSFGYIPPGKYSLHYVFG
ncbi:leucine-rich repeat receptor-like tyrosine-protein kinase PXC3 isoform X2 [Asparagus officinalis]|uniref:leucine-rich repeat receptor-like tyrosine-protein kinase PXC3 isoform X2 n=1 Tax=Asparagus officinalis TaxID=4686 RepID=UPI00098DEA9D|nr:leucine-rich repeat receptor-like tyrosine-protein kinase PXC3 isoform X2 [Asparagus officinalis]